ncbi:hypothetical protein WA1_34160 [Scytonema hofmannii PCC 7110]|uniref:Uncharacterized protein n=1 Tax=Scytonema hofmannii PCC 7110 TaxID=128403 RepID=A0A139X2W2_9CYAN|nr:hypothetical protein [Scytonema hofmannii]KYC39035.1 hypothetical protein WA1_34160 [Scytonema hofmannii PCC 7110]
MMQNFLERLGDWNPQLLREIRGRLKIHNVLLTISTSLLTQLILCVFFAVKLPPNRITTASNYSVYCTGSQNNGEYRCLHDGLGHYLINWQLFWQDIFTWLSIIVIAALLVAGTYLLTSDLATEQRRETLNFIRLSPQSPKNVLWGKLLGVPILLYIAVALTVPLHLWSGLGAKTPFWWILSFYALVLAACIFYYSAALLFGLVGSWLGGFQAWLASGVVLGFLILTRLWFANFPTDSPIAYIKGLNPFYLIPNLDKSSFFTGVHLWKELSWFTFPLGVSFVTVVIFFVFNYSILACFIWQALWRCFRDPNSTMLSKQQSYWLTAYFAFYTLGFVEGKRVVDNSYYQSLGLREKIVCILFLNLWLFLFLIAAILPHRQLLQDWIRYRKSPSGKTFLKRSLIHDLIWGEKSPALVAIALNAIILITPLILLSLLNYERDTNRSSPFFALALAGSLAMVYAALAQFMLFMKNRYRIFWTIGILTTTIVLPVIIAFMFGANTPNNYFSWLFSVAAPLIALFSESYALSSMEVLIAILCQWAIVGLLVFKLKQQLEKADELSTK